MASEEGGQKEYDAGAPTMAAVEQFGQTVERSKKAPPMVVDPSYYSIGGGIANDEQAKAAMRAANAGKFPVRVMPSDPYDTTYQIKEDLANPIPGQAGGGLIVGPGPAMATPSRPLPWTKDDIKYLQRKRDAEENAAYLFWQATKYDLNDPATRDWFQRVCPSYFDQRSSLIEEQIDAAARYSKIRLRGPKSEDDYKFEWMVETGRLKLPEGPIWDPYKWMTTEAGVLPNATAQETADGIEQYNQTAYRRGLWNPIKVMTPQKGGLMINPYNKGDISGMPNTNFVGPVGVIPVTDPQGRYNVAYGGPGLMGARDEFNTNVNNANLVVAKNVRRQQANINTSVARNPLGYRGAVRNPYPNVP